MLYVPVLAKPPRRPLFLMVMACFFGTFGHAQRPPIPQNVETPRVEPMTVKVAVRDSRGMPLESAAMVHLHALTESYDMRNPTQEASTAVFPGVMQGNYEIEVTCTGFKDHAEQITVNGFGGDFNTFIFLEREGEAGHAAPTGVVMTPKLMSEFQKGLESMRKHQFDSAHAHFLKATKLAPSNPDTFYLLGTAELGLQHLDPARAQFEHALQLDPSHERALQALGELQIQKGETAAAIETLEKAFRANGADWRVHLLLAIAYARARKLADAETHAERAATLAQQNGSFPLLLLGEIQYAQGKRDLARTTWQHLIQQFPKTPDAERARDKLAHAADPAPESPKESTVSLPLPPPTAVITPVEEHPWAPPDVDSREYPVASGVSCQVDDIITRSRQRMKAQIGNYEKFTATERIEHQEIDRRGVPGPLRSREFSYIVFVHRYGGDSIYMDESRNGTFDLSSFPTALATFGMNSLGVSVLQPDSQNGLTYHCEGLSNLNGQATWQIRFEEKKNPELSIRQWSRSGTIYDLPVKGRFWVSASSFDVIRIESDLMTPVAALELRRDHLQVDYRQVIFENGKTKLWLPETAEMFMEIHNRRYHHKHLLTNYMLFSVDTTHKISTPQPSPPGTP